ncbi:MAG TPA: efflux RND transporter periplasmic adaptor subunit [Verrucomicrobiae bacterium]|nr:efflux RND transporter periplasmic adaptor subunit [Verrucomicrobiae bacterium]
MKRKIRITIIALVVLAGIVYYALSNRAHDIVITGIVTTDSVIVSSEIQGRLQQLLVKEGDTVKHGQLLAVIQPQEWKADMAYYRSQQAQTSNQISQAEANLASAQAQVVQAQADLENDRLNFTRIQDLFQKGVESAQSADQARTTFDGAKARVDSLEKQVEAAQSAVQASHEQLAATGAQTDKAQVHLDYTEVHAPIDGIVDVRAALQGEVVNPGQGIVTLINPDDLWVRADVEEGYVERFHIGDKLKVTLPSGDVREGTVFFRGVDADYATQRDVNRSKRDIKTFEIRLRCDNSDRSLALGMSAYVTLPLAKP